MWVEVSISNENNINEAGGLAVEDDNITTQTVQGAMVTIERH